LYWNSTLATTHSTVTTLGQMKRTRGGAVAATPSVPSGGTVSARRNARNSRMFTSPGCSAAKKRSR
jgi:hypothetical protein